MRIKAVFTGCKEIASKLNTRDHLERAIGNGYLMHGVCPSRMGTARVEQEQTQK